jgi:glycosyltransferase involved in cell wall biosynthesis
MRIAIHDYGGYPFTLQLARGLAAHGHTVHYLYSVGFVTPKGDVQPRADDPTGFAVEAIGLKGPVARGVGLRRFLRERQYASLVSRRISELEPDVVASANTPLDVQQRLATEACKSATRFVFWMQDVYSKAVGQLVGRRNQLAGRIAGARFSRLEAAIACSADAVVPVSPDFVPILLKWGVQPERITVIPNWAQLAEPEPPPKDNPWARSLGLHDQPVLLYSGTLGRKHDPKMLLTLAEKLPEVKVVVVAEGVGMDRLRKARPLPPNLVLLPLQPATRYPELLAASDILVALLEGDASAFSVPSKILSYLTSGRPILAAMPPTNLAARTITEAMAGTVIPPGDSTSLARSAQSLMADELMRQRLGANGRRYAARNFAIGPIVDRFEQVFSGGVPAIDASPTGALRRADGS